MGESGCEISEKQNDAKTSDDIIADLLNDVQSSTQPFSVDKIAGMAESDVREKSKKKDHKSHKHKSKKKKKEKSRSRSRSNSKQRKRSRSPSKKHKKKRDRSKSPNEKKNKKEKEKKPEKLEEMKPDMKEEPVKEETEPPKPSTSSLSKPIEIDENYDDSHLRPLVNDAEDYDLPLGADYSTLFCTSSTKTLDMKLSINIKTVLPEEEYANKNSTKYDYDNPEMKKEEPIDEKEEGEIDNDDDDDNKNENEKPLEKENNSKKSEKREKHKDKSSSSTKKKKRKRSRSSSANTDELIRKKTSEKSIRKSRRSRSRSKEREKPSRKRSPVIPRGRGDTRYNHTSPLASNRRWDTLSPTRPGTRGRSRSNERNMKMRSRSREGMHFRERNRSTDRRRNEDVRRRRSRSRDFIDKEKLLAIAKKKRAQAYAHGDREHASMEDFVTYCKRLQRRQEREKRRERGEALSDDNDSDDGVIHYKHPYALPKEPIRFNIVSGASMNLAQRALMASEEQELDATQMSIMFPVSSGAVHKENAEWTPVIKENNVPKSCTNEQKKHVALTSYEIERCRQQGIPVVQNTNPTFLQSILPPPPPPPQFLPDPNNPDKPKAARPVTPPSLPCVLYVPPKESMIMKDPRDIKKPAPNDISATLKQRADAQKKLHTNPNDFEAHKNLREANEKIELWAALKSLPGEYTGTTGLKLLTPEELQPSNPKYNAWVKRDQFKNAAPAVSDIGMRMMKRMGWKQGEGLGKDATGNVEPLVLEVKSDRKGLIAEEEMSIRQRNKINTANNVPIDFSTKNPISLLMEFCAKRRLPAPTFICEEEGQDHSKLFVWTVVIDGNQYRPLSGSRQKKEGKTAAAHVALQSMGIVPRDPNLPVCMH